MFHGGLFSHNHYFRRSSTISLQLLRLITESLPQSREDGAILPFMDSTGISNFDTAIGPCEIAWHAGKIIGVEIGDADENETRYRLQSRFSDPDFSQTPLALDSVPDLNRQVYEILLELKAGETITYGAIARRLGDVSLSQAVGYALGKNPFPIIVPCHRVLGSNGKVGGFSAAGGTATKLRLLNIERARTSLEPDLFGGLPLQARPEAE